MRAGLGRTRWGRLTLRLLEREEVRYLLVAGTTTLVYLALVGVLLLTTLPYMVAILLTHAVMIPSAFPVYRSLIFRSTGRWQRDLPRFAGVWSGGFVGGIVLTPLLVEIVGMHPFAAQVVAVAVMAVASYLGHRFVTFRRHPDEFRPVPEGGAG